ncbi:MAG: nucleotidyltransferase substrate binding protein [Caldimicrobium sp.]|nr:nucleotidyltransferase substrate binding protein [Caldimicrobium sp.]MCX7873932.1 nucleotidyltransferase substrate binding protein [Caldimicrobium sp.]MDW8094077.1 HI0074 family nucleotidyltransferase substrate-binding subunit [Caldimicrobium sp.]
MRERVKKYFENFQKALRNLKIGVETSENDLDIDGTLKRFELCYELAWKLIKVYLEDLGIICRNPRDCFKQAFQNDLIHDVEKWYQLLEDRNLLVHTYTFEESKEVFERVKLEYLSLFEHLFNKVREQLEERNL